MSDMEQMIYYLGRIGHLTLESYENMIDGSTSVWRCRLVVGRGEPGGFEVEMLSHSPMNALQVVHQQVMLYKETVADNA